MFIFAYGSLKKNFKFHYYLENSEFISTGVTKNKYAMYEYYDAGFPYLSKEEIFNVKGEIYKIDKKTLKELDKLEGYPTFYDRELIDINLENGENIKAYTYFLKETIKNISKPMNNWLKE